MRAGSVPRRGGWADGPDALAPEIRRVRAELLQGADHASRWHSTRERTRSRRGLLERGDHPLCRKHWEDPDPQPDRRVKAIQLMQVMSSNMPLQPTRAAGRNGQ